jgi:hypothetical protein
VRVGIISRGSPDYLIDIAADGLIRLLGRQSVSLDCNLRRCGIPHFAHLYQGFEGPEPFPIEEAEVLVASLRSEPEATAWRIRTGKTRIAILDGEDEPWIRNAPSARVYFKRELIAGQPHPGNVRPLPFGAIPEQVPSVEKRLPRALFMGAPRGRVREEANKVLSSLGFLRPELLPKAEYNRELASSLIGVSAAGAGWDTYRYWETAYFGAALLSQRLAIEIPGNFEDGREAVFWNDIGDFRRKLEAMLADPGKTAAIGEAGRKACLERHLSIHRAKTILEALA